MIDRCTIDNTITMSCDECGDELDGSFQQEDFQDLIRHARNQSWTVKPTGQGGWQHNCPDCDPVETPLQKARALFGQR